LTGLGLNNAHRIAPFLRPAPEHSSPGFLRSGRGDHQPRRDRGRHLISGIPQAAEDLAALCLYNAYDYFIHLRLKHLPKTDLFGPKLEFDIDYDQALDGAIRLDTAKFPSVS